MPLQVTGTIIIPQFEALSKTLAAGNHYLVICKGGFVPNDRVQYDSGNTTLSHLHVLLVVYPTILIEYLQVLVTTDKKPKDIVRECNL